MGSSPGTSAPPPCSPRPRRSVTTTRSPRPCLACRRSRSGAGVAPRRSRSLSASCPGRPAQGPLSGTRVGRVHDRGILRLDAGRRRVRARGADAGDHGRTACRAASDATRSPRVSSRWPGMRRGSMPRSSAWTGGGRSSGTRRRRSSTNSSERRASGGSAVTLRRKRRCARRRRSSTARASLGSTRR